MSIRITPLLLHVTAGRWDAWADTCDQARRDLQGTASTGFGPPSAALDTFLDTWGGRAAALRDRGQRHADALRSTADGFDASDADAAASVTDLLPWGSGA